MCRTSGFFFQGRQTTGSVSWFSGLNDFQVPQLAGIGLNEQKLSKRDKEENKLNSICSKCILGHLKLFL